MSGEIVTLDELLAKFLTQTDPLMVTVPPVIVRVL
jgi:hypothetical protein